MRYQELIYIQNEHSGVRNKDILNVNMSSDICIFDAPIISVSGASKINCTGSSTSYVIAEGTSIPIDFSFSGDIATLTGMNTTFNYEIYKYSDTASMFTIPAVYKSNTIPFSGTSSLFTITDEVQSDLLPLDGEFIIKCYFTFDSCTRFLKELGKTINTRSFISGTQYGLYDNDLDFYFAAIRPADVPYLLQNNSNNAPSNKLVQQIILPEPNITNIIISQQYAGFFVVTLNGLVLSPDYDYTFSGNVVTLNSETAEDDIISIIYTTTGGNNLIGDNYAVSAPISSGATNGQGSNTIYYNTTTTKFELFTSITPALNGSILVMINGATLASGIDYYQSTSNPKRIILEGELLDGDIITIVYFPFVSAVNGLITNNPTVSWSIENPPQLANGVFTLEVSSGTSFSTFYYTGATDYLIGQTIYSDDFIASGTVGTTLYYRVKNQKNYETFCGNIITDIKYSDIIPVIIQTNSINSY